MLRFWALATALLVPAALLATPAEASLGKIEANRIYADSLRGDTPTTWNAHLPKMASAHGWVYFVYTRDGSGGPAYEQREAIVLKRRVGTRKWIRSGRVLTNFLNLPGLVTDAKGRLHLVFTCLGNKTCTPDGVNGEGAGTARFHDLIFSKRRRDGSFRLTGRPSEGYPDTGGPTDEVCGYLGVATDPHTGETFGSTIFPEGGHPCWQGNPDSAAARMVFGLGASSQVRFAPAKVTGGTYPIYPQLAISPSGARYYTAAEWVPGQGSGRHTSFGVYRWSNAGFGTALLSDHVEDPVYPDRVIFASDMAFGPHGELYVLYMKRTGPGECTSYLVKETGPGSGVFSAPVAIGCRSWYAQLQVDSRGRIYIVEQSFQVDYPRPAGPVLFVSESDDAGRSWKTRYYPLPTGPNGLPNGSTDTWQPTLTKPWDDPTGYSPNVLHGFVANWRSDEVCGADLRATGGECTWSAAEFTIPIRGKQRSKKR